MPLLNFAFSLSRRPVEKLVMGVLTCFFAVACAHVEPSFEAEYTCLNSVDQSIISFTQREVYYDYDKSGYGFVAVGKSSTEIYKINFEFGKGRLCEPLER